ncbi:MAG: DUF2764 family protein [Pseudomonadota bacterium]|nr:DUF2764 family protein [Pseudomonadota bacterium]
MATSRHYYTLIASLPHLPPHFDLRRTPISRPRLDARLRMLTDQDRTLVVDIERFMNWSYQSTTETDASMRAHYDELIERVADRSVLLEILRFRASERTVMAALRRRKVGKPPPAPGEIFGIGNDVQMIKDNWDKPDFGLGRVYPWIDTVRRLIDNGEAAELEKTLFGIIWHHLNKCALGQHFSLESLIIYLCRWDIVDRYVSYEGEAGLENFKLLVTETLGDTRDSLFA